MTLLVCARSQQGHWTWSGNFNRVTIQNGGDNTGLAKQAQHQMDQWCDRSTIRSIIPKISPSRELMNDPQKIQCLGAVTWRCMVARDLVSNIPSASISHRTDRTTTMKEKHDSESTDLDVVSFFPNPLNPSMITPKTLFGTKCCTRTVKPETMVVPRNKSSTKTLETDTDGGTGAAIPDIC